MDGYPASSKFDLLEAFAGNIIYDSAGQPGTRNETAIFVTANECGAFYDSGFVQWVDFFGTGLRIPMIAVSPFSTGGHVSITILGTKISKRNFLVKPTRPDPSGVTTKRKPPQ
jgi:phospholipase C